jgi:hypothetical protein
LIKTKKQMGSRIDEIRNLIGDVEFLAAINEVIELTTSLGHKDLRDDGFLLKANQVQLNQDKNKGLGSSDELAGRQNKIVDKVLDLLTTLENRVMTEPEPPKAEPVVTSKPQQILHPKINTTTSVTTANNNLPKVIIAVLAGLLILFFGYRFMKSPSKNPQKEAVAKVDTCEEGLKRIEEAIAAKDFEFAKKGLFKADKICTEKIQLSFLLDEYNKAVEEAKQVDAVTENTENENVTNSGGTTKPNEPTKPNGGTKPDGGIKPGILKPGILTIDPSKLLIKPGALLLDTWTGTWESDFGEVIFIQTGKELFGDYSKYNGWIFGEYNDNSKSWKGVFYNGITKKEGSFEFVKSGKSFTGTWRFNDNSASGNWKGSQTSQTKPTLKYFPTFSGRVYDINGKAVEKAKVSFNNQYTTYSDENGAFSLNLPYGKYKATAAQPNYQSQTLDVKHVENSRVRFYFKLKEK